MAANDNNNSLPFNIVMLDREGKILYADESLVSHFTPGQYITSSIKNANLPVRGSTFVTKAGLLNLYRIETAFFRGYCGIVFHKDMQNEMVKSLLENNKELDAILNFSHDAIVVADSQANLTKISKSYFTVTGVPPSEILGRNMRELVEQGTISDSGTMYVLKTGQPVTMRQRFRTGFETVITSTPIFDENHNIIRVITNLRDSTEINKLKEQLDQTKKQRDIYSHMLKSLTKSFNHTGQLFNFRSTSMQKLFKTAIKYADVDSPLLITGESGSGKEVLADAIHQNSQRQHAPFLKINCGAIPENLLESELFGYERGAFTGAKKEGSIGLLEMANKGMVLLDEVGEMPLILQTKLLRFVEKQEFFRIGGKKPVTVDVRILAATHRDLRQMVQEKTFRLDLYYRLNVLSLNIPPLRDRRDDIIPLMEYFLRKFNEKYKMHKTVSPALLRFFLNYHWPGNIRQLEHLMEHAVITAETDEMLPEHLPDYSLSHSEHISSPIPAFAEVNPGQSASDTIPDYNSAKREFETNYIARAVERYGSVRKAARHVGLSHSAIVKKAARYGVSFKK